MANAMVNSSTLLAPLHLNRSYPGFCAWVQNIIGTNPDIQGLFEQYKSMHKSRLYHPGPGGQPHISLTLSSNPVPEPMTPTWNVNAAAFVPAHTSIRAYGPASAAASPPARTPLFVPPVQQTVRVTRTGGAFVSPPRGSAAERIRAPTPVSPPRPVEPANGVDNGKGKDKSDQPDSKVQEAIRVDDGTSGASPGQPAEPATREVDKGKGKEVIPEDQRPQIPVKNARVGDGSDDKGMEPRLPIKPSTPFPSVTWYPYEYDMSDDEGFVDDLPAMVVFRKSRRSFPKADVPINSGPGDDIEAADGSETSSASPGRVYNVEFDRNEERDEKGDGAGVDGEDKYLAGIDRATRARYHNYPDFAWDSGSACLVPGSKPCTCASPRPGFNPVVGSGRPGKASDQAISKAMARRFWASRRARCSAS